MQIVCSFPEHHFLLSSGQFTKKPHKAREAKYGKFAYSSAFGFSVPTGNVLEQIAPDSTLSVSNDDGDTWKVRWDPRDAEIRKLIVCSASVGGRNASVPVLASKWSPWRNSRLEIETILVPPSTDWPGWYVRLHKLSWHADEALDLICVDAGFAISSQTARGGVLPTLTFQAQPETYLVSEGVLEDSTSNLIRSGAGACGAVNLSVETVDSVNIDSSGFVLKPDANTNLIAQRTLIPTIRHHVSSPSNPSGSGAGEMKEVWFATGIFAVTSGAGLDAAAIWSLWNKKPAVAFLKANGSWLKLGTGEIVETWKMDSL